MSPICRARQTTLDGTDRRNRNRLAPGPVVAAADQAGRLEIERHEIATGGQVGFIESNRLLELLTNTTREQETARAVGHFALGAPEPAMVLGRLGAEADGS